MRIYVGLALLLLMTAVLFYTGYRSNKLVLASNDARGGPPYAVASQMARKVQAEAERYHHDLGRWPDSLQDLELDAKSTAAQAGIERISFGSEGAMRFDLTSPAGSAAIVWTPTLQDDEVHWQCVTDRDDARRVIAECRKRAFGAMAPIAAPPADREESEIAVPGLEARCQLLGRAGYAAAQARAAGDTLDTFVHRPIVAFQDDASVREDLKSLAKWVYDAPARSPSATQRDALRRNRCL
jgi:hypothetical protein